MPCIHCGCPFMRSRSSLQVSTQLSWQRASMAATSPRSHSLLIIPASTRLMQNAPRNFIVATTLCSALPQAIDGPRPLADVLDASLDCIVGTWIDVAAQLSPHSSLRLSLALALADLGGVLLVHEILDDVVQVGIPPGQQQHVVGLDRGPPRVPAEALQVQRYVLCCRG